MSQSNGFSYSPHFKTSAVKRGPSSSYQELSNGYNKLYQPQAYAAMDGAPNVPHYPFQQHFVAYPANMMTTNDGENTIGTTVSQDSSNGFAFPVATTQTLGNPALDGSSMQQVVKINHQHPDTTFAGGPQAQMMVAYPSGYIRNTNFDTNGVSSTREESSFPGMQNQIGASSPMYALSGNSQPQHAASRLEVHTHTQAIQRSDLTSNNQSRASSQPIAHALGKSRGNGVGSFRSLTSSLGEKVKRGDKDNSRLTANAQSKPRARSALPGGSGYHGQIPLSDGRQRTMNHVPSQSDASRVTSPPTPLNLGIQSSVASQRSFQGQTYVGGDGIHGSQKTRAPPQASDHKSRIGLSESSKSQRRSFYGSVLSSNPSTKNMQLDHSGRELAVISPPNTHNLQRNLTIGEGPEQNALSPSLSSLVGDRYSEATPAPSNSDNDSNLVTSSPNSQVQRTVSHVETVKDGTGGFALESANGVEIGMEIKETIEKMLQYKSMLPTVFSKIWVQVKKDQEGQEIEAVDKSNASSNGDRKIHSPIPSQNHLGSRSQLSIEPLQKSNLDAGSETSQQRKRKSSEIVSRTSESRRQLPNFVHLTQTPTIPRSFPGLTKPTMVERSIESPAVNGSLNPLGNHTSHRELSAQTTTSEVTRAMRSGLIQAALPPAGTPSTWSKEKKKVLAQALRNKLASISGNASTAITTDEIIRTFNNTPSMAEVRRSLKDRGLNISAEDLYGWWCDTLLKYDARAENEQQRSKLEGPPLHHGSRTAAPSDYNDDSMKGYAHDTSLSPSLSDRHHNLDKIQKPPKSLLSPPMDGNRRKRSYASIIDLTSEQFPTVTDGSRTSRVGMEMTDDVISRSGKLPLSSHADTVCHGKSTNLIEQTANKRMRKSLADEKGKDLSHFEYAKSQQDLLHSNIIITPMDVKKALRRSTYKVDSIAKDVLMAAAKHPTEAPLNHHIDVLRNKFVYVNSRSDLSTFRWELVDPGPDDQNIPAARSRIAEVDDTEEGDSDLVELRKSVTAVRHQKDVATNNKVVRAANADTTANQSARGRPPRQEKVMNRRFSSTNTQEGPSTTVPSMTYSDRTMTTDKISKPYRQSVQKAPNGSDITSLARKRKGAADASLDPPHSARTLEKRPQALPQGVVRFKPSFTQPRDVVARSGSRVREASPTRLEQRVKARLPVTTQDSKPSRSISLTSRKSYSTPMRPSGLRNFLTPPDGIAVVIQSLPPKTGSLGRVSRR